MKRLATTRTGHALALAHAPAIAVAVAVLAGCVGEDTVRNTAPEVSVGASLTLVKAGTTVSFSAGATDAEANIISYDWDFGDGATAVGSAYATVDHAFAAVGTYVVALTATDEQGLTASGTLTIDVTPAGGPPTLTIDLIEVRGRVVDETVQEVVVNGTGTAQLQGEVFTWTDDTVVIPESYTFDVQDEGANTDSRALTLTEM